MSDKFEQLILDRFDKIENQFNKIDTQMSAIQDRLSNLEQTTAWIKGKLEGRSETRHVVLTCISIATAIGAVLVAILK